MPYINQGQKNSLATGALMHNAGELNYRLTKVIEEYRAAKGDRYQTFNDILGALSGASAEFYRRIVAPYEDKKREENGDVYADLG